MQIVFSNVGSILIQSFWILFLALGGTVAISGVLQIPIKKALLGLCGMVGAGALGWAVLALLFCL